MNDVVWLEMPASGADGVRTEGAVSTLGAHNLGFIRASDGKRFYFEPLDLAGPEELRCGDRVVFFTRSWAGGQHGATCVRRVSFPVIFGASQRVQ